MAKWNNPEITELNIRETATPIDDSWVCPDPDCKFRFNMPPGQCKKCDTYLNRTLTNVPDTNIIPNTNIVS